MERGELEGLANKIASEDCTPLERFNIKMYVALQGIKDKDFNRMIEEKRI